MVDTPAALLPPVWIPDDLWERIQASVPIVCVDVVPVLRDASGDVRQVGLISRLAPVGQPFARPVVWCPVGGRVNLGESLAEALNRHLLETLGVGVEVGPDPQPHYVMQWLREEQAEGSRFGWDPRKHSVGLTFVLDVPCDATVRAGGEGIEFVWFPVGELPSPEESWPGALGAVRGALEVEASARR